MKQHFNPTVANAAGSHAEAVCPCDSPKAEEPQSNSGSDSSGPVEPSSQEAEGLDQVARICCLEEMDLLVEVLVNLVETSSARGVKMSESECDKMQNVSDQYDALYYKVHGAHDTPSDHRTPHPE